MFTGESKYGYQDGEHFANWGEGYPVFVRVVNGQVYAVAREENPGAGSSRFFRMFMMSREWIKNTIFSAYPTDADLFTDKPNNVEDTSVPANQFIKSSDTTQLLKRPNSQAVTVGPGGLTPVVPPPATTSPVITDPVKPAPTNNTTPTTTGAALTTANLPISLTSITGSGTSTPNWLVIALVSLAAIAVIGVIFFKKRK